MTNLLKSLEKRRTSNPQVARSSRAGRAKPYVIKGKSKLFVGLTILLVTGWGLAVTTPSWGFDPWSKQDIALEGVYLVLKTVDWGQSRQIARQPEKYYEFNPILGKHPSVARVDTYFLTTTLIHLGITHALPAECRPYFQGVTISFSGACVLHNLSIGLRVAW